jgi:putative endonuclease
LLPQQKRIGSSVGYLASGETPCHGRSDESSLKMYYVYIIESVQTGIFYKGSTEDYNKRLQEHNDGLSQYTRGKGPWKLIFVQCFSTRHDALIKEKRLKRCNKEYLRWLVQQSVNILNNNLDR